MERLLVSVVRYSFFESPTGTLRYAEHSPATFCEEKQICNCTRSVAQRPAGIPQAVQQHIKIEQVVGDYAFELSHGLLGPDITFRWKGPEKGWTDKAEPDRTHAYFMCDRNGVKNSLGVEITVPGHGLVDTFFGRMFFGNDVDTSRLMNGHAPSRIVELGKIPPDQVWAHDCHWGSEAISVFQEEEEAAGWRAIKKEFNEVSSKTEGYVHDLDSTVDGVRIQVLGDEPLLGRVLHLRDWFMAILKNLKETEMWRACDEATTKAKNYKREE